MTVWPLEVPVEGYAPGGLRLRAPDPVDAAEVTSAINASLDHLRPYMEWATQPVTVDQQAVRLAIGREAFDAGADAGYIIFEGDDVVGGMGLHRRRGPGVLEIGYWVRPDREGRGIVTSAVAALLDVAFGVGAAERVVIRCDVSNHRSAAVPQRLGFSLVDVVDETPVAPAHTGRMMQWELRAEAANG